MMGTNIMATATICLGFRVSYNHTPKNRNGSDRPPCRLPARTPGPAGARWPAAVSLKKVPIGVAFGFYCGHLGIMENRMETAV